MKHLWNAVVFGLMSAFAVLSLALRSELAAANEHVAELIQAARRSQVIDRLTGRELDVQAFLSVGNGPEGSLIWFLDMDACSGCFDSVAAWNTLVDGLKGRRRAYIVVIGTPSTAAALNLRTARRDSILHRSHDAVRSEIGNHLPNTKLVVGADSIVELVDSRYSGQFCGWTFEALVARHLGVEMSVPVRGSASTRDPSLGVPGPSGTDGS